MIKGEIRTDAMTYDLSLEQFDDVDKAYAYVKTTLDGDRTFKGDGGILEIGEAAQIKHIRVYEAQQFVPPFMQDQEEAVEIDDAKPRSFKLALDRSKYLGNSISMICQAYTKDGHTWYLPMEINDQPAYDVLGSKHLEDFIHYWNMSKSADPNSYTVIVPPAQLPDYEEAEEYIKDFVAEMEAAKAHDPKEKNAKAWQGYRHESD